MALKDATTATGTLAIEEHSVGAFVKDIFSLRWNLDALVGDGKEIESPSISRTNPCSKDGLRKKWKLTLVNRGAGNFLLTLCSEGQVDQFMVLNCKKTVEYILPGKSIQLESATSDISLDFEFDLPNWATCSAFKVVVSVLEGTVSAGNWDSLRLLYENAEQTDFVLVAPDDMEIKAHRTVLAAGSDVFETMLKPDTKESQTGRVTITDVNGASLKVLIDWMYGVSKDLVKMNCADLREIYAAADKYHVVTLLRFLVGQLRDKEPLQMDDCAPHYLFASRYNLKAELRDVMARVARNYSSFAQAGGPKVLSEAKEGAFAKFVEELNSSEMPNEDGIILWKVPDVRKISASHICSPSIQVRSLPWDLRIRKKKRNGVDNAEDTWMLGIHLFCGVDVVDTHAQTCHATGKMKIVPFQNGIQDIEKGFSHAFPVNGSGHGFLSSVSIAELMDPAEGWVDPADFSLQLEVEFTTKPPQIAEHA